jgi:hypothetical protein
LQEQLWISNPSLKPELKGPGLVSQLRSAFVSTALQLIEANILRSNIVAAISAMDVMSGPVGQRIGRAMGGSATSTIFSFSQFEPVSIAKIAPH